jgi:hypothetical protein
LCRHNHVLFPVIRRLSALVGYEVDPCRDLALMNLIIPQLVGIANIRADNKESTDAHKETGRCSLLPVNAHFLLQQTYGRKTTTVLT